MTKEQFKKKRKDLNYTQQEWAEFFGSKYSSAVSNWERGVYPIPATAERVIKTIPSKSKNG
jgi:DNA-binding transcriptional regulator YiaG